MIGGTYSINGFRALSQAERAELTTLNFSAESERLLGESPKEIIIEVAKALRQCTNLQYLDLIGQGVEDLSPSDFQTLQTGWSGCPLLNSVMISPIRSYHRSPTEDEHYVDEDWGCEAKRRAEAERRKAIAEIRRVSLYELHSPITNDSLKREILSIGVLDSLFEKIQKMNSDEIKTLKNAFENLIFCMIPRSQLEPEESAALRMLDQNKDQHAMLMAHFVKVYGKSRISLPIKLNKTTFENFEILAQHALKNILTEFAEAINTKIVARLSELEEDALRMPATPLLFSHGVSAPAPAAAVPAAAPTEQTNKRERSERSPSPSPR